MIVLYIFSTFTSGCALNEVFTTYELELAPFWQMIPTAAHGLKAKATSYIGEDIHIYVGETKESGI